ncbi:PREDICTED: uncharacterized protein LOC109214441 [Nicotiana attenuata]|uniref:uncharacterized protein LOC109214441 n=1 Tax=Nicotiana attenuata TaxID=49451 RepID=UPI000904BE6B|nr:PREDICTED: uncharacterized protein LOC109214441 [Nicotiana attenuata]
MELPPGFRRQGETNVCKLMKPLYGLKQASRQCNIKLTEALSEAGYKQSLYDYSLFTKRSGDDFVAILICVDDLLITRSSNRFIQEAKDVLHQKFKVKDLGELRYFLGIEIARSVKGILLNQRKYALQLISDLGLGGTKPAATPVDLNQKFTSLEFDTHAGITGNEALDDITAYQRLIGRLLYLTITRPDISYIVHTLSQFMQAPKRSHRDATVQVVKRSMTGFIVKFGESLVSWKLKKQQTVSRSSAKAEYRSLAAVTVEATWL